MKKRLMSILILLSGILSEYIIIEKWNRKKINAAWKMSDKHLELYLMMNEWVRIKQEGKNIPDYLERNNYKTIAIYGMSYAGERLLKELQDTAITVEYGIDKKADEIYSDIDIVFPNSELKCVDAIIVTSIGFMEEIKEILGKKIACPIISLKDILYDI